ncbi:MAG: hypothetical protein GY865_11510, partial [candidate division Zixibacteria bacterium]|nr:hypothetical protein [candidate division Zixibacteria bacterium]
MNNKSKIESLSQLLESWANRGKDKDKNHEHAKSILESSESILKDSDFADTDSQVWHNYLNQTGHTDFLMSLGERDLRYRWAET